MQHLAKLLIIDATSSFWNENTAIYVPQATKLRDQAMATIALEDDLPRAFSDSNAINAYNARRLPTEHALRHSFVLVSSFP